MSHEKKMLESELHFVFFFLSEPATGCVYIFWLNETAFQSFCEKSMLFLSLLPDLLLVKSLAICLLVWEERGTGGSWTWPPAFMQLVSAGERILLLCVHVCIKDVPFCFFWFWYAFMKRCVRMEEGCDESLSVKNRSQFMRHKWKDYAFNSMNSHWHRPLLFVTVVECNPSMSIRVRDPQRIPVVSLPLEWHPVHRLLSKPVSYSSPELHLRASVRPEWSTLSQS